jgi:hypothetical protein
MLIIPRPERPKQEDLESEASLGYIAVSKGRKQKEQGIDRQIEKAV